MMKQLKGLGYLKSLKLLSSILLIGFFGLGVSSFVNGYVDNRQCYSVGAGYGNNGYGWCYELQPNENFVMGNYTNSVKDFFNFDDLDGHKIFLMGRNTNDIRSSIWWNGNNLYSFTNRTNGYYRVGILGGFCVYNGIDISGMLNTCFYQPDNTKPNYNNSYYYYTYTNEELISIFKGETLTKVIYTNGMSFGTPTQNNNFVLCGVYENINKSFCVSPLDITDGNNNSNLNNLYGNPELLRGAYNQNYVYENYGNDFSDSPLYGQGGDSGTGDSNSEIIYYSDNNQVYYDTFKAIGFDEDLCYSNFSLTDIVDIHTAYYDLFPSPSSGSGASIFELYNNWGYSSNNPFNSYFSWYLSRYNRLNSSSDKGITFINSLYSGVSIGNYYIFDKLMNHQFLDSYSISYKDYYSFCDMAINGFNPDGLFTGGTSISFDNIMISEPCIRNGTCINENGSFIFSGANSQGYFEDSSDFVDIFNKIYTQVKNVFKVDSSLSGTVGILPAYIIFGFFMFLLLYGLKR